MTRIGNFNGVGRLGERTEDRLLAEHLDFPPAPEERCPRCDALGCEPGTAETCQACLGEGWV